MRKTWTVLGIVLGLTMGLALPALAQGKAKGDDKAAAGDAKPAAKMAGGDKKFAQDAWMVNLAEVKLGELAGKQAASDDVKSFASMMVEHHGKAQSDLEVILKDKGMEGAKDLDAKHKALSDKLGKLSGAAFDKAYTDAMIKGHTEALKKFEKEAKGGKDEGLKAYADKTKDVVKSHLDKAAEIKKKLAEKK